MDGEHLRKAAREILKAAERAREFAELCEFYAGALQDARAEERAERLRLLMRSKLAEVREAVADSEEWRSRKAAA